MLWRLMVLSLALTAFGWAQPTVRIGDVVWYTNYDDALAVAQKAGKPLWLHFGENPG